uniref:Protein kinase domain-containing protein n=1 Tax=Parastrongyloides trichosuri TaxID=131310 RepID=A0A0N4ZV21_PARTI
MFNGTEHDYGGGSRPSSALYPDDPNGISLLSPSNLSLHSPNTSGIPSRLSSVNSSGEKNRSFNYNFTNIHSKIQQRHNVNQKESLNPRHLSLKGNGDDKDSDYIGEPSDSRKDRSTGGGGAQKGSGRQLEVALRKVITERLQHLKDRGTFHLENYGLSNLTSMQIAMYMRRLFKRNDLQNYMTPDMINYVFGTPKNDGVMRSTKNIMIQATKEGIERKRQRLMAMTVEERLKCKNDSDTDISTDEEDEGEKYNDFTIVNFVKHIPGPTVPNIQIPPNKYQPLTRNSNVYRCARDQAYIYGRGKWIEKEIENLKQRKAAIASQIEMIRKKKVPIIFESTTPVSDITETCSRLCAFKNKNNFKVKLVNKKINPLYESMGTPLDEFKGKNKDTMAYYSKIDDRVNKHLSLNGAVPGDLLFHKYLKRMASMRMVNKCSTSELNKCRQLAEVSSTPWTLGLSNAFKKIVLSEKDAHDNEILKMTKKKEKERDKKGEDKGDKNDSNNFYTVKAIAPLKLKLSGISRKSDKNKSSNKRKFEEMFESEDDSRNTSAVHTADEDGDTDYTTKPRKISKRDSRRNSGANMSNSKAWNSKYSISTPIIDVGCKLPTKADYAEIIVPSWSAWESPDINEQGEICPISTEEYDKKIEKYHEEMEEQEKSKVVVTSTKSQKKGRSSISKEINNVLPFTAEELLMSINGSPNKTAQKVDTSDVPEYDRPSYAKPYERRIFENSKAI